MKPLLVGLVLIAVPASAQTFAPGAVQSPPPMGRHFLDSPVATCVIAVPVSPSAVMLTPCPPGTGSVPPAPAPPGVSVTPLPITPPVAAPKEPEPREPLVLRIEVVPVAPAPAPKITPPAPKAAPKKGPCPC